MIGHLFSKSLKKQFYSQKHAYHAQIEALSHGKKDNENGRHFALKVETLLNKVGIMNTLLLLTSNVMKFSPVVFLKN